jgi:hypothetical protein
MPMSRKRPPSPRCTEKERIYRALFEEAEERGLSLPQLAVERDIAVGTLSWWRSEIRRRDALRRGVEVKGRNHRAEERIEFVSVEVAPDDEGEPAPVPSPGPWLFEVELSGGATVRVPPDFEEDSLTRVVRAVRAAC